MNPPLTHGDLASLIKSMAGVTVDPAAIASPGATFDDFGVDSLSLLGIVGELENRHGTKIGENAETAKTPQEFLDAVNASVKAGA